jgi:hypothetical protein
MSMEQTFLIDGEGLFASADVDEEISEDPINTYKQIVDIVIEYLINYPTGTAVININLIDNPENQSDYRQIRIGTVVNPIAPTSDAITLVAPGSGAITLTPPSSSPLT